MPDSENEVWSERLLALGLTVQTKATALVQKAFRDGTNTLADAVSEEGGDRIYRIDREVEATIECRRNGPRWSSPVRNERGATGLAIDH